MGMKIESLLLFLSSSLMIRSSLAVMSHVNCRNGIYPRSNIRRFSVPDDKVPWSTSYANYKPPKYTDPGVYGKIWADPDTGLSEFKWNNYDGDVNRMSHTGEYLVVDNLPLNAVGRTGISGRGLLGRWGPNHAADTVVTRWKQLPSTNSSKDVKVDRSVLQFVAVKRRDTGEWALPGGMVDPGESVVAAAIREFQEEAINSLEMSEDKKEVWRLEFEKFFSNGDEIYKGYVDDPRNTDNAWMETVAFNYHDERGHIVEQLKLQAGDDAASVRWVDITPDLKLYASHKSIIDKVLEKRLHPSDSEKDRK